MYRPVLNCCFEAAEGSFKRYFQTPTKAPYEFMNDDGNNNDMCLLIKHLSYEKGQYSVQPLFSVELNKILKYDVMLKITTCR